MSLHGGTALSKAIDNAFKAGYQQGIKDSRMLKMLQRIDSKMTVTFDDLLEIKKLIKEVTSINEP